MEILYSVIDALLPFEWTEFQFMKNAFVAVLLITPLFGLVGTMIVNNRMSFFLRRAWAFGADGHCHRRPDGRGQLSALHAGLCPSVRRRYLRGDWLRHFIR